MRLPSHTGLNITIKSEYRSAQIHYKLGPPSKEMKNQCDQMARLFFFIWLLTIVQNWPNFIKKMPE